MRLQLYLQLTLRCSLLLVFTFPLISMPSIAGHQRDKCGCEEQVHRAVEACFAEPVCRSERTKEFAACLRRCYPEETEPSESTPRF